MGNREQEILEGAVHAVAEQAAKAGELVDEATAAGGGSHPVTIHAKMLRLELLNVKVDLERELEDPVLNCRRCGLDVHWVTGLGVQPGYWGHREPAPPRRARRPMTRSSGDYFNERMVNRQLLIWAIATRRQIERWEPLVAANLRAQYVGAPPFPDAFIWEAATEHHFLQIAARNLIRAIDLATPTVPIEPKIRAELIEGRNLHEHWVDNLPVLSVTPRAEQPKHRSGKAFAARNPGRGPYWWLGWTNTEGPMILPNVPAQAVHELVDRVEATVMARDSGLRRFIPPRQPSPWLGEDAGDDRWWPREPATT